MASPLHEQHAALAAWLANPDVRAALDRKDWRTAFGSGYPRVDLGDEPVPWRDPPLDLCAARLMLVGSGGLFAPGQPRFDDGNGLGDTTWREFAREQALDVTELAHEHYDHTPGEADRNVVFPLERLRELAASGEIGGLTATHISLMGYIPDWAAVMDEMAPELARRVAAQSPDAAVLVPV